MAVTIGSVTEGNANAEEIKNNSPDSELYENNKKYLQGSLVKFNDKIYLAKRNVPSDVDLDNPYYWEIFMDAADSKRVDELFEKTGRSWSKVWTLAVAEDIAGFEADDINLDGKSEIMIVFISDSTASRTMANGRLYINGVDAGKVLFNSLPLRKDSHSFVIIGKADEGIEYTTMQATAEYQTYPWQGEVKIVHRMVSGINPTIQWISGSIIKITQGSATLGKGVTIEIYVR